MSLGPIRPRFKLSIPGTVEALMEQVQSAVADPSSRCVSRVAGQHVDITVVQEDRHRWSPCVSLEFQESETDDEAITVINGLIGPHPNMWTLFAFINITLVVVAGFGLMVGLAQRSLGMGAWGLWVALGGAVMLVVMYLLSQVGQRMAEEQSRLLIKLVEASLGTTM